MRRKIWIGLALSTLAGFPAIGVESPAETGAIQIAPSPIAAPMKQLVHRWHRHYRGRMTPVLREWEELTRAAHERPGRRLTAGCRRLELALTALGRQRLPVAPDPSISLHLEETLRSLADAADSCAQGAYFLTSWRLRQADNSWRELRGRLLLYDLAP